MMDKEEQMQGIFNSRLETLTAMFNRFKEGLHHLDPHSAIVFSDPMCDILTRAIHQLETYKEGQRVDELLKEIFKNDNKPIS